MKLEDVTEGKIKIGGTTYNMVEVKYGGVVVWPTAQPVVTHYVIVSSWYEYSDYGDILLASGANYAVAYGNVEVRENGVTVRTLTGVRLDVSLPSSAPQYFYIYDNCVYAQNLQGNDNTGANSTSVYLAYDGHTADTIIGPTIYQEYNHEYTDTYVGERVWDSSSATTRYTNYSLVFAALNYYDVSHKCAATGGSTTLNFSASHHEEVWEDWTRTDTVVHTFTSGYTYNSYPTYSGNSKYSDDLVNDVTAGNTTIETQVYSPGFSRNGTAVTVANMGTTPWPSVYDPSATYGRSITYRATLTKYDGTTMTQDATLYQAVNKVESQVEVIGEKQYGTPSSTTQRQNYYVYINSSAYKGTGSAACPASGGTATLTLEAGHSERTVTETPWVRYSWTQYTWTTGQTSTSTPSQYDSGTDTTYGTWHDASDPYTISITQPSVGDPFEVVGTTLTIPSEGTDYLPNGRSATISIVNDNYSSASDSLTLYQAANNRSTAYTYTISVAIVVSGTMPYTQGIYAVNYVSKRDLRTTYSSGDYEDGETENTYSGVSVSPNGVTASTQRVSGQGTFTINVPANGDTQLPRTIAVTLTAEADSSKTATDSKVQDAAPATINANLSPWISPTTSSPYAQGVMYVKFHVTQGVLASTTVGGVVLHTITNGGSEVLTQIGTLTVTNDANPMPRLKDIDGHNVIAFMPGSYGEAWFTATSTGAVNNMSFPHEYYGEPSE